MKSATELGVIVAVAVVAALGNWLVDGRPSPHPLEQVEREPLREGEIALKDAPRPGEPGVVWIDARREEAWRDNGLPGSIHLTVLSDASLDEQIGRHLEELAAAETVIVYCDGLHCELSHELIERIGSRGIFEATFLVLHGGAEALEAAGLIKAPTPAR